MCGIEILRSGNYRWNLCFGLFTYSEINVKFNISRMEELSMEEKISKPTDYFGANLAILLANKISLVHKDFNSKKFIETVKASCPEKSLTQRVELIADNLKIFLPANYKKSIALLIKIMGEENANETGMFREYY